MCDGRCRCLSIKQHNERLKEEIRELILELDDDMKHYEFVELKIKILSLLDEVE